MCGGRPASRLNERWVVELVVLERERSRLVVRLVATAVELLLLRRRVGAWRWRIFLFKHRRCCSRCCSGCCCLAIDALAAVCEASALASASIAGCAAARSAAAATAAIAATAAAEQ